MEMSKTKTLMTANREDGEEEDFEVVEEKHFVRNEIFEISFVIVVMLCSTRPSSLVSV